MSSILNIIVFYDNYKEIVEYIKNVFLQAGDYVDIAVVVNKDSNSQSDSLICNFNEKERDKISFFDYKENVGYLNSLCKTIKKIHSKVYKYYILSNTDIKYPDRDFFSRLMSKKYDECVGCIGPSVYAINNNSYSNPHCLKRPSATKIRFLQKIFSSYIIASLYDRLSVAKARYCKSNHQENSCYMYSPHGCYMIFTETFINMLNGFEYGVKLYSEESCIGELLNRYGLKCIYDCDLSIIHFENSVTGTIGNRNVYRFMAESYKYILDTFYS